MAEYIDRELIIKAVRNEDKDVMADYGEEYGTEWGFSEEKIIGVIMKVPVADAAPVVHGKWVHLGGDEWRCSSCGNVIYTEGSWEKPDKKYCEECGAKMDAE